MRNIWPMLGVGILLFGCTESSKPCEGPNGPCIEVAPGADFQKRAQEALAGATYGDVVYFPEGTHAIDDTLNVSIHGLTIRGAGMDETILQFTGASYTPSLLYARGADGTTIEDLSIQDTSTHAIVLEDLEGPTVRRVGISWATHSPNSAVGVIIERGRDALVEDCHVVDASVESISIRDSEVVAVRGNSIERGSSGINIQNSDDVDVYDNTCTNNTVGMAIFNLPDRGRNGRRTRVYNNTLVGNNGDNHAPVGNILQHAPTGIGMLILSGHEVEVFGNHLADNQTSNLTIMTYQLIVNRLGMALSDVGYNPYVDTIYGHDNRFGAGGDLVGSVPLGILIKTANGVLGVAKTTSILFDGYVDPNLADPADPTRFQAAYNLCFQNNKFEDPEAEEFSNLDDAGNFANANKDFSPHLCAHEALPAIKISARK